MKVEAFQNPSGQLGRPSQLQGVRGCEDLILREQRVAALPGGLEYLDQQRFDAARVLVFGDVGDGRDQRLPVGGLAGKAGTVDRAERDVLALPVSADRGVV